MRSSVEEKIEELELKNTVTLYGFKSNPYPYLANSKVLCMPSKWEGYGLVAAEALVFEKPVIASPVGGIPGIVNEPCGSLCKSKEEFVDVLERYLNDIAFYEKKVKGARLRASELDNFPQYFKLLMDTYYTIIKN